MDALRADLGGYKLGLRDFRNRLYLDNGEMT